MGSNQRAGTVATGEVCLEETLELRYKRFNLIDEIRDVGENFFGLVFAV